jgi:hypothetical protein
MKHFPFFEPASNEIQVLTAGLVRIVQKSTPSFLAGSRLFSTSLAESGVGTSVEFDTSGKSPAYLHHRKNFRAGAGKPAAGILITCYRAARNLSSGRGLARPVCANIRIA